VLLSQRRFSLQFINGSFYDVCKLQLAKAELAADTDPTQKCSITGQGVKRGQSNRIWAELGFAEWECDVFCADGRIL